MAAVRMRYRWGHDLTESRILFVEVGTDRKKAENERRRAMEET